jgi:hyaluronan synthase
MALSREVVQTQNQVPSDRWLPAARRRDQHVDTPGERVGKHVSPVQGLGSVHHQDRYYGSSGEWGGSSRGGDPRQDPGLRLGSAGSLDVRPRHFDDSQHAGIAAAIRLAEATATARAVPDMDIPRRTAQAPSRHLGRVSPVTRKEGVSEPISPGWHRDRRGRVGDNDSGVRRGRSRLVASQEVTPGALNRRYEIPRVRFNRKQARGLLLSSLFLSGWIAWHLGWQSLVLALCAAPNVGFRAVSWILSWFDQPVTVSTAARRQLDRLHVTVAIPVYNEDPGLLDRCLYALANQSRPPQLIFIVDDGSKTDYTQLRRYWEGSWPAGLEIRWLRQANQGKRRAHAAVFDAVPDTDIFVTVDSDTTLDYLAIEEGLKPFRSRGVMSVAGIEMGFNATANLLTRMQCSLQLFAQGVIGAAWSVAGDMYTNRGPFALYRASAIRKYMPVYRDEFFCGRRISLGDDSLLALCASAEGRSVQQLSAFGLTMWPESMSHHLRQRIRWARGRTVRNFWRIKYRPVFSYCWWFTIAGIYSFLFSICLLALLVATWPASEPDVVRALVILLILSVPNSMRTLCFPRSDETMADRVILFLVRPLSALWSSVVLAKIVRIWGTCTFLRQGWTTRQHGAELVLNPEADPATGRPPTPGREAAMSGAA